MQVMPLAKTVAKALGVAFIYEWYGDPDHCSYRVSYQKSHEFPGFRPEIYPADSANRYTEP